MAVARDEGGGMKVAVGDGAAVGGGEGGWG